MPPNGLSTTRFTPIVRRWCGGGNQTELSANRVGASVNVSGKLTRDGWLLFATRCSRMFAYGLLSVVLVLYLVEVGLKEWEVGLLLTLTLAGDTAISLWLTTTADRLGGGGTLVGGAR